MSTRRYSLVHWVHLARSSGLPGLHFAVLRLIRLGGYTTIA